MAHSPEYIERVNSMTIEQLRRALLRENELRVEAEKAAGPRPWASGSLPSMRSLVVDSGQVYSTRLNPIGHIRCLS